ncbi:SHOCT domain-containing protein [Rhizobium oryzicola]|uniref:SHOCT domain-containing protein n=1 Tax=Rhizobium oryzicola TaxID=1232668 RepID=A0ABT8SZR3_9HYPH|nr:SHOCT domain-containing protein [Rhizobium oryzicola]MDO1583857.1 SHOCT domain-containing protein [Rhizobium oryzicola]
MLMSGRLLLWMGAVAMPLALSGCSSDTFALTGRPTTAPQATVVGPQPAPTPKPITKLSTGEYPSVGRPLTAANTQIADQDFDSTEAKLTRLANQRKSGAITEAEYKRRIAALRQLGSEHAADAEREIAK